MSVQLGMNDEEAVRVLKKLEALAYETSYNSGFHADDIHQSYGLTSYKRAEISQRLMLIVSEAAEAMEELRVTETMNDLETTRIDFETGKVTGFASELADIIIRVWDLAAGLNLSLPDTIVEKMKYNTTRSNRHGKKF